MDQLRFQYLRQQNVTILSLRWWLNLSIKFRDAPICIRALKICICLFKSWQLCDENGESDIELGEMSEGEEDSTPNSATPLPSLDQDLDQDEEWTEFSGPVQDLPVDSGLLDYFKLFFFDSVLNMIVEETNRYMQTNSKKQREQRMCTGSKPLSLI